MNGSPGRSELQRSRFRDAIREQNVVAARVAAWLVATINPCFALLDRIVIPAFGDELVMIRTALEALAISVLVLSYRPKGFFREHVLAMGLAMMVIVSWSIEAMVFMHEGYGSPYYAGICLVTIATGYVFLVTQRTAALYHGLVYVPFIAPAALGIVPLGDVTLFLTHQLFLISTIAIVFVSQRYRFQLVEREFYANLDLELTKSSLEDALASLRKLDELKNQFFNNVTHELRTPLTMILAPAENLRKGDMGHLNGSQQEFVETIWRNGIRLLKLINDLLDLARLSERYLYLQLSPTTLRETLSHIVDYARPLAARKKIELSLSVAAESEKLFCDIEKIERVVVNVVSNALKFTEPGGSVQVELGKQNGRAAISVRDTGIGIPGDKLSAIFERFSQADPSITRRFGGTGIGLAFADSIVRLHGGRIDVKSSIGQGSTFTILLPLGMDHFDPAVIDRRRQTRPAETAHARRSEDREPREWAAQLTDLEEYRFLNLDDATERRRIRRGSDRRPTPRVLVVEDNLDVAEFIQLHLQNEYTVLLAADGQEGLRLAREKKPDAIATDYMMPVMDGLTMLRELRKDERTADIPVIMLTAKSQLDDRLSARQAGADVYLSKPFSPHELRAAIAQQVARRGRQAGTLLKANLRSLEVVSAGLAHEINNPLGYIGTASGVVEKGVRRIISLTENLDMSAEVRTELAATRVQIDRMSATIALGLKKIERIVAIMRRYAQEGYSHAPLPVDLDSAIRDLIELVAPRGDKRVTVQTALQAPGAQVVCIAEELHQAISGLVQNAVDAVGEGGLVMVRTRVSDGSAIVEVEDDGPGIEPDHLAQIFTPFFTTKPPGAGMGLGLCITQRVVEDAGGTIDVVSAPGDGTLFRVTLPIHPESGIQALERPGVVVERRHADSRDA